MSTKRVSEQHWLRMKPWSPDMISVPELYDSAVHAGYDAWGKAAKSQPLEMSVKIGLQDTVSSAASADMLNESTLHYGNLRKVVEASLPHEGQQWLLPDALAHQVMQAVQEFAAKSTKVNFIEVVAVFLESSLSGDGTALAVSLNQTSGESSAVFHLRDATLLARIGINPPEQKQDQKVIVNVWIDRVKPHVSNECYRVEQIVVKTIQESAFGTLESLCERVAANVIKYFIIANQPLQPDFGSEPAGVRVKIEKPRAVPRARRGPSVEIYRSAQPDNPFGKRMYAELGKKRPQIPFPLEGRLSDFLQGWKQD